MRTWNAAYGGIAFVNVQIYFDDLLIAYFPLSAIPTEPSYATGNGYWVMEAGERIHVINTVGPEVFDFTASGYLLTV